jgi:hypothetical protein
MTDQCDLRFTIYDYCITALLYIHHQGWHTMMHEHDVAEGRLSDVIVQP